jgi:hypothetical protein
MRLRSDIYAEALIRRANVAGAAAYLRRRGAAEAGAIFVCVDCLDGRQALFGPAPQNLADEDGLRRFVRMHAQDWVDGASVSERLAREQRFDSDLWIIDIEDRAGRVFFDLA